MDAKFFCGFAGAERLSSEWPRGMSWLEKNKTRTYSVAGQGSKGGMRAHLLEIQTLGGAVSGLGRWCR
jgi:hypothetical protein